MNEQGELFDTQSDYRERILDAVKGYHRGRKCNKGGRQAGLRKQSDNGIPGERTQALRLENDAGNGAGGCMAERGIDNFLNYHI